jgi:hypothetical protein
VPTFKRKKENNNNNKKNQPPLIMLFDGGRITDPSFLAFLYFPKHCFDLKIKLLGEKTQTMYAHGNKLIIKKYFSKKSTKIPVTKISNMTI